MMTEASPINKKTSENFAAFEIETTTPTCSDLLGMADLFSMQPNLIIPLYIVAPG